MTRWHRTRLAVILGCLLAGYLLAQVIPPPSRWGIGLPSPEARAANVLGDEYDARTGRR